MEKYGLYINGEWVNSTSGETFESINPATEEVIGIFQKGNKEDVKSAVEAAESAFEKWSSAPPPVRGEILFKATEILKTEKERLGKLVTTEMGKVIAEGLGDVQEAIDIFEYMAGEGRRLLGHTSTSELHDKFSMTVRRPVGIAGLITPWNFPIAIPAWKLSAALICGNTVVLKPASDTPLCAVELVKILERAGLPKGVINMVTGSGEEAGTEIATNNRIRVLSFTGSKDAGEFVLKNAGIKRVGLELGSKNPVIIMDDADIKLAVDGCIWGGFGTTGQRCTAASRVIVHKNVKEKFEKIFVERAEALTLGNGIESSTNVGPLINEKAVEKSQKYVDIGNKEGARILCGGEKAKIDGRGFFYKPTVFTDVKPDMKIAQDEIFGPVVSILEASSLEEAIKICNSVEYGLSSAIYTNNIRNAFKAIEKIDTGITYINASTIGAEVHLPFGGVKSTGNGTREAGIEGINEFTDTKTVYFDYSGRLQRAQIDVE
ncbi:MAG: aldehyde dehydrogenase family protein [Firmicutes bacterium]|nr:aldehyde dehydrogenase family protein [Bacillota bacterium]